MSPETQERGREGIGHRIVRAMFVVIFFQLFWKFGGLILTLLVGSVFGASAHSDAYLFVSETVIFLLQTACLKVFIPVVVPVFKERVAEVGEEDAWAFGSSVLTLAAVALGVTCVAGMVFAPRLTALMARGFNEQQAALASRFMRLAFPGVFAICLATVTYALLNSYNIFSYAAAGDAVQKLLWAGVFFVASMAGLTMTGLLDGLAVAFLTGAAATLLVHLFGLRSRLRFFRPGFPAMSWRRVGIEAALFAGHLVALAAGLAVCQEVLGGPGNERRLLAVQQLVLVAVVAAYLLGLWARARKRSGPMARFAALSVPLLFGILFAKYRDILTNLFASFTGIGVFSDLKYARKVGEAPNTLVIAALSIAILPHLCELATGRRWEEFGRVMTRTIRMVVLFFVPLAALCVVLRRPIIQLLFDRGNWTDYHLSHAGDALGLYILSLPFFAIENPVQQSFFAMQRMWTPTLIGFLGTGFHILFLFVGIEWLGFGYFAVVALVYVAARAFKNVILLAAMRYHVRILPWRESVVFLAKALAVTMGVILATHYVYAAVRRVVRLERYRRHEVVLDIFNIEPRGWESANVADFRAVGPGEELPGGLPAPAGRGVLAGYYRSPRRTPGLRLDIEDFDLAAARAIRCRVAAASETALTFSLVTRERRSYAHPSVSLSAGEARVVELPLEGFGAGPALGRVVGLWIRDTTPAERVESTTTWLLVSEVTLVAEVGTIPLARLAWRFGDGTRPEVEDTGERPDASELALHIPSGEGSRRLVSSSLALHRLARCDLFRFKARADKPFELTVRLVEADGDVATGRVRVHMSDRRRGYSIRLADFAPEPPSRPVRLEFDLPPGVGFWLDNPAFVREPPGPRLGGLSLAYEAFKVIHVGVPSAVALVAFVALTFLLRIEEGRQAWEWFREKALARLGRRAR